MLVMRGAILKVNHLWTGIIAISVALLLILGACGSEDETRAKESHSDHSHDHGSAEFMSVVSPDGADVLIEIEFRNGVVYTSKNRVSISRGDQVVFSITSDVDEFMHVHGVDLIGEVFSGSSRNYLGIQIQTSGIFEIEFENSGIFIAELMVS